MNSLFSMESVARSAGHNAPMNDKNGKVFGRGLTLVDVPEPEANDLWSHSFTGTVVCARGLYVTVRDQDDDCWDIEPIRLEIIN